MFKTGSPVKGKDFIDRKKHLPLFIQYLENEQHIMIKAPRRFGKTSLVKQVFEYEKNYDYIYVDLRRATNLRSLSNQILNKAYAFAGIDNFLYSFEKSITTLFKTIQKVKIDEIGELSLRVLENNKLDEVEYFLHTLDVVEKIAEKKSLKIKFVLDEFQDILRITDSFILEQARAVMQHHENVTYVFLGSIETVMSKIFEDKTSSFFHFARVMQLGGLDINELYEYVSDFFDNLNVKYDASLKALLVFLNGHPDYSSQVLQGIYFKVKIGELKKIEASFIKEVLKDTILENRAYLEELIIKAKQKKHHFDVLHSIANDYSIELNSKTLYSVNSSLEEIGLIKNISRGKYIIVDIFLEVLLKQKDDEVLELDENILKIKR